MSRLKTFSNGLSVKPMAGKQSRTSFEVELVRIKCLNLSCSLMKLTILRFFLIYFFL